MTTNDRELALKASRLRLFGEEIVRDKPRDYISYDLGYNFRMTEMAAAVARVQLKRLDKMNEQRRKNAETLNEKLKGISIVSPPYVDPNVMHVYHMYSPTFNEEEAGFNRDLFIEALRAEGVPVFAWQQMPLHKQPVFQNILPKKYREIQTPVAEKLCRQVFNWYIHPPNGIDLMREYLNAFQKIFENIDELKKRSSEISLRAPKDWGVPRS